MKTIKIRYGFEIPENFTGIVEWNNGTKIWYKESKYHRLDGPAIEWVDGDKAWYKEDVLHREDGPAIELADGTRKWYKNNKRHREDGPAVIYQNGYKEWYLNNQQYTKINLKDYIVLDQYQGSYNLIWYKLLGKNKIIEYPDIPGLITK